MSDGFDVERLRALAEQATPGPWAFYLDDLWSGATAAELGWADKRYTEVPFDDAAEDIFDKAAHIFNGDPISRTDAEFIAAANPAVVLSLLAELVRVTTERDQAQAGNERVLNAVRDLMWRFVRAGDDRYLITKGTVHRLMGAMVGSGHTCSFRADDTEFEYDPKPEEILEAALADVQRLRAERDQARTEVAQLTEFGVDQAVYDVVVAQRDEALAASGRVQVHFRGGPWADQTDWVDRVVGPVFAVGHAVGGKYWLDTKSDPPTYHWRDQ